MGLSGKIVEMIIVRSILLIYGVVMIWTVMVLQNAKEMSMMQILM